jgi:hypothetical protein
VAFVRTDVSEERIASIIIMVKRISEIGIALAHPKRRFFQEPHDVTFQRAAFFI